MLLLRLVRSTGAHKFRTLVRAAGDHAPSKQLEAARLAQGLLVFASRFGDDDDVRIVHLKVR
jgi:hypothetical protein